MAVVIATSKTPYSEINPKYANSDCLSYGKQCKNGGRCVKLGYKYTCQCMSGYNGVTCDEKLVEQSDISDICTRIKPCLNGGECSTLKKTNGDMKPYSYECTCDLEFEGGRCETKKKAVKVMVEKTPPCDGVVCQNNGVCVNNLTTIDYYCFCGEGSKFSGKLCNECSRPNFVSSSCDQCAKGFAGENCDLTSPFCSPNPCENGLCLWDSSGFRCVCSEGG